MPFTFIYEPSNERKKKPRDEPLPDVNDASRNTTTANVDIDEATMKRIGEYAGQAAAKRMKEYIEELKDTIVQEILKRLTNNVQPQNGENTDQFQHDGYMNSPEISDYHEDTYEPEQTHAHEESLVREQEASKAQEYKAQEEAQEKEDVDRVKRISKKTRRARRECTEGK